jgi:hypothetical protein
MTATISPTSVSPTARQLWTRVRGLLLGLVILLAAGIVMAAIGSGDKHGRLDPRSSDPLGSRAVTELLKERGVAVDVVTTLTGATAATAQNTTLLVTAPDLLDTAQQRSLLSATRVSAGRTVLLGAGPAAVPTLAPGVTADTPADVAGRPPHCALPAARSAGTVDIGGERYLTDLPGSDTCYTSDGLPTLLRIDNPAGGDTVLLGSPDILYNNRLDKQGNASLALQLLGSRPHLVWYLPSLSDDSASTSGGGEGAFLDLIPAGWLWGLVQLLIAAALAAAWRARRLGPLVTEQLPVAVRASESTEGRARLYRKTNARDRAATVLRAATRERLAPLLGLRTADAHSLETLTAAVSARLPHKDLDLPALLFGPAPADDTALVRLADQLDALEREVRTS